MSNYMKLVHLTLSLTEASRMNEYCNKSDLKYMPLNATKCVQQKLDLHFLFNFPYEM